MKKSILFVLPIVIAALAVVSCSTVAPQQPVVPLTKKQLEAMAEKAKQPQLFGIVVYPSEAGPVFGGAMRTHEGEVGSINFPLLEAARAPVVPVGIGGSDRHNALLDTSAQQSWAALGLMRALRINLLAAPSLLASRPNHVFEDYGGILGVSPHLKIGDDVSVENVLFQVRGASGPIGPLARGLDNANIEVVLGLDFMKAFNHVLFDFPGKYVILSASSDCRLVETNVLASLPMQISNGVLSVAGRLDGAATNIVLDTGGDFAFALPGTDRQLNRVKQASLGDLVLRDQPATPGMDLGLGQITHPRIGRLALSRYKMTLDFRNRLVHFERP